MIAIIDYGAGNLQSVAKAFHFIGSDAKIVKLPEQLNDADMAVLPGVGSFGDSMECLQRSGLIDPILRFISSGKPFLGICLGLQLLFEESEESPGIKGLGIFKGKICQIPANNGLKIPHMGWNSLEVKKFDGILKGLPSNPYVYFVHSFYLKAQDQSIVSSTTEYGVTIDASIQWKNLFATQFHPEKSGEVGLKMLRNFVSL